MYIQNPLIALVAMVLNLYWWVVIIAVIVSWLTAFNVINSHNNFVRSLLQMLYALTEPVFRQIRKVIPSVGGLDLSPVIVLLLLSWMVYYALPWVDRRIGS